MVVGKQRPKREWRRWVKGNEKGKGGKGRRPTMSFSTATTWMVVGGGTDSGGWWWDERERERERAGEKGWMQKIMLKKMWETKKRSGN